MHEILGKLCVNNNKIGSLFPQLGFCSNVTCPCHNACKTVYVRNGKSVDTSIKVLNRFQVLMMMQMGVNVE